jgi:hypothetical protein
MAETQDALTANEQTQAVECGAKPVLYIRAGLASSAAETAPDAGLTEALDRALNAMEGVTIFVTSKERINRPSGEKWWREEVDAVRAALSRVTGGQADV